MASSSGFFTSNTPHFFKIVLPHTLQNAKFEVPRKFVRDHGDCLLDNKVSLTVSDGGDLWDVGLEKRNGQIWFSKGLKEFIKFYCVKFGHFLVFKYDPADSRFHVVIFDMSASEIRYPKKKSQPPHHHDHKGKAVVVVLDDDEENHCFIPNKKMKTGQISKPQELISKSIKMQSKDMEIGERLMEKALTFQSMILNPSFLIKLCPSSINPGNSVGIPIKFARIHLKEGVEISLQVSNGRTWNICYIAYPSPNGIKPFFSVGWKRFVIENKLEEGSVCVFEMIKSTSAKVVMKVVIFQAGMKIMQKVEVGDHQDFNVRKNVESEHGSSGRKKKPLELASTEVPVFIKANSFKCNAKNPSFTVIMQPAYIETGKKLGIPRYFTEKHLKESSMMVIQVHGGRAWNVKCQVRICNNQRKAELASGWRRFVRGNNLQIGDVCVFELIETPKKSFKVTVFPRSEG